jgi:hypothetical protein
MNLKRLVDEQAAPLGDGGGCFHGRVHFLFQGGVHVSGITRIAGRCNWQHTIRRRYRRAPLDAVPRTKKINRRAAAPQSPLKEARMVTRMSNGIIRTEPIHTSDDYPVESPDDYNGGSYAQQPAPVATEGEIDWSNWERWMESHKSQLLDQIERGTGYALGMTRRELRDEIAAPAKRITKLELKLAQALGALDILRGKGIPGGLNIKGTYSAGMTYIYGDVVMFGGSSWVATRDNPGNLPNGGGWQLLCGVGKRGERGLRGARGEPGMSAVAAPTPAYWRTDPRNFSANLVMTDGSMSPPLELREMFVEFLAQVRGDGN